MTTFIAATLSVIAMSAVIGMMAIICMAGCLDRIAERLTSMRLESRPHWTDPLNENFPGLRRHGRRGH